MLPTNTATAQLNTSDFLNTVHDFLKIWQPKDGSNEIWLKVGHNQFYKGIIDGHSLTLWETSGEKCDRKIGQQIGGDGWEYLFELSHSIDGGVFYIPTQPQGFPLKEYVSSTDDIGIELDGISRDDQLARYADFEDNTGIQFAAKLSSGGKSIHAHIKFDQHYPLDVMTPLRRLAILALRADPAIANVHQPMRFPGFYRREKQAYQELLSVNPDAFYSPDMIECGLMAYFENLGWQWPDTADFLNDEWWREFQRLISSASELDEQGKIDAIGALLATGFDDWKAEKERQQKERQQRLQQRKIEIQQSGKFDLVHAVEQVCDVVGAGAFDWHSHNWQWSGDSKARGCCPWHESTTGTAGWIGNQTTDGRWLYGCEACFGKGRQINAFEYWWRLKNDTTAQYPEGKDYAIAAREFLTEHGVTVPEWKAPKPTDAIPDSLASGHSNKPQLCDYNAKGYPTKLQSSAVAKILAEEYRDKLAWNVQANGFYRYGAVHEGLWSYEDEPFIHQMVQAELDSRGASGLYSSGYISSIYTLMRNYLVVREWDESHGLIPFRNGVLELATKKLLPYSPGYRLTWQLPYDYSPLATCDPIQDWLISTQDGDEQRVQLLRAYLKAIVTGRADLQRYLECIGPAATGKSTFTKLAIALVGIENTHTTTLDSLERNRFEPANLYRKRLVVINDADRYGGKVNMFKSLTGQDTLPFERKNEQAKHGFVYDGMVILTANETIQSSDYTSGLERRRLTVPFLQQVRPQNRRDLISITQLGISGEFVQYLPGLMNWVLALPDSDMVNLVRNTQLSVPSLAQWKAESLLDANPIADWVNSNVIAHPGAKTYVGWGNEIRKTENDTTYTIFEHQDSKLYPNYRNWCRLNGNRPLSVKRFVNLLNDLCTAQLHWEVKKFRDANGSHFEGIALRHIGRDIDVPLSITGQKMTGSCRVMTDSVTVETIGSVSFDGCVGLNWHSSTSGEIIENDGSAESSMNAESQENELEQEKTVTPVKTCTTNTSSHQPTLHTEQPNPTQAGDSCLLRYVGSDRSHWGKTFRLIGWLPDGSVSCVDVDGQKASTQVLTFTHQEIAEIGGAT